MNELNYEEKAKIIRCLLGGSGIRAAARITGHSKNTVKKLLLGCDVRGKETNDTSCFVLWIEERKMKIEILKSEVQSLARGFELLTGKDIYSI